MTIRYIPKVGDRVKLRFFEHYTSLMIVEYKGQWREKDPDSLVVWAWLIVDSIDLENNTARVTHDNAGKRLRTYTVPLSHINPPLGWHPVYTINCRDREQADNVLNDWFNRGISCWTSHAMSSMGSAFTPLEKETNKEQHPGHWKYTNNPIEIVPIDMCRKRFNVHVLTTTEVKLPDSHTSKGKRERKKILDTLRSDPTNYVYHMFDFGNRIYYCEHTETIFTHEEE